MWMLVRAFSDEAPTGWREGDVVEVRADGAVFGGREGLPRFVRVHVPCPMTPERKMLLEAPSPHGGPRRCRVDLATLPVDAEGVAVCASDADLIVTDREGSVVTWQI